MKLALKKILMTSASILALGAAGGVFILCGGCSTTHTRTELDEVIATTNRDTLGSVYYKGRKDGFDYFKARWNVGSKNMRVAISESPITKPIDYTTDESEWRLVTFMHLEGRELELAIPKKLNAEQDSAHQSTTAP